MKKSLIFSLFFIISQILFAQKKDSESGIYELFDVSLEEILNIGIVTASKKKQNASDAPASAYIVTKEQIQQRGYTNLLEILEDVPEIEIQRNSIADYKNLASIRGIAGNEKFIILLNGVRITPATGERYILSTNFSLANVIRVEVILGPASALYGVDAFSGIINLITESQENPKPALAQVSASVGNFGTVDSQLALSLKADKLKISLVGGFYQTQEPNLAKYYPNDLAWFNSQFLAKGKVIESPQYQRIIDFKDFNRKDSIPTNWETPSRSLYLQGDITYGDFSIFFMRHTERHSSSTGLSPEFAIRMPSVFVSQTLNTLAMQHRYTSFNKKWTLQSTISYNFSELSPESNYMSAVTFWNKAYRYEFGKSVKLEEQFTYDFSKKTSLIVGGTAEHLNALARTTFFQNPFDRSIPATFQKLNYLGRDSQNETLELLSLDSLEPKFFYLQYENYGIYSQLQTALGQKIQLTAGMRYDYNTRYGGAFNPRIGLVFSPLSTLRLKLMYGESFLSPSPNKAFEHYGSFLIIDQKLESDFFRLPAPNLEPEKLRSLETNLSFFPTPNVNIALNGFYTEVNNLIENITTNENKVFPLFNLTTIRIASIERPVNRGKSRIYGGTFKLNWRKKWGTHLTTNPYLAYTLTDGTVSDSRLLFTAKHTLKGGIDLSYQRFSASLRGWYRSESYSQLLDGREGGNISNLPFLTLNFFAQYQIRLKQKTKQPDFVIFTKFNNLTDNRFYHVFSGNAEGLGRTPQDPLRFALGFRYNWE